MLDGTRLWAAARHPLFVWYVLFLWGCWVLFQVLPNLPDVSAGSLIVQCLLALVLYAVPVALVIAAFGPKA